MATKSMIAGRLLAACLLVLVVVAVAAVVSGEFPIAGERSSALAQQGKPHDTDGDGVPDNQDSDIDNDGLTNEKEAEIGTSPNLPDTDGDTLSDAEELAIGTDPKDGDSDDDGFTDGFERSWGTDPNDGSDVPGPDLSVGPPRVQVSLQADGDDPDGLFSDFEETSVGSSVTFRVTIDNDGPSPVTVISLISATYGAVSCVDGNSDSVVGRVLQADDGDGSNLTSTGPDAVQCTFIVAAPDEPGIELTDVITLVVEDVFGDIAADDDDATIIVQ
ncbi:MAG TPA: hypothetical protein VMR52_11075 [Dehalococcoidia bacterium]|nr:hypothetical protein [Dehalococcoidia bacterium]